MYTEFIIFSILLFFGGIIFGKFIKNLNPFLIILGLVLFIGVFDVLATEDNLAYNLIFTCGVLMNFKRLSRYLAVVPAKIKGKFRFSTPDSSKGAHFTAQQANDKAEWEKQARKRAEQEAVELKARLNRKEEELRKKEQHNSPSMPQTFADVCNVLGVSARSASLAEFKKARIKLLQQYHQDKCSHLGERLQEQAKLETQRINQAWDIVKRHFMR